MSKSNYEEMKRNPVKFLEGISPSILQGAAATPFQRGIARIAVEQDKIIQKIKQLSGKSKAFIENHLALRAKECGDTFWNVSESTLRALQMGHGAHINWIEKDE